MVIGTQNRVYRNASGLLASCYTTATPPSADYSVEADLYYKGAFATNAAGVIGRFNTGAHVVLHGPLGERQHLEHREVVRAGPRPCSLSTAVQPALVGGRDVSGQARDERHDQHPAQALRQRRAEAQRHGLDRAVHGRRQGRDHGRRDAATRRRPTRPASSSRTSRCTPSTYPRAADSKGTNTGDYMNGVTLGAAGALAGDTNTAATVRRGQRLRAGHQQHRPADRRGDPLGGGLVQDEQQRPAGAVRLRHPRQHPGVRAVARRRRQRDDCLGVRGRQRQAVQPARPPSTTAAGTRSC